MRHLTLFALLCTGCVSVTHAADPEVTVPASSFHDLTLTKLDGSTMPASDLKGKAVLVVNVASKCGFTPQYEGLQALYEAYADKGLVILGQPCNQFGSQEPGSADEIASFCKMNFGVTFPLLAKADVNGGDRNALYSFLVGSEAGGGADITWNFEKFLVSPEGQVVGRWGSRTKPSDDALKKAIEAALPKAS